MGAIFGILRLDGAAVDPGELARMGRAMAHCGPDGRDTLAFDGIGLGACLAHVNREDVHEAQPLHDTSAGVTMVADMRLDNREALAREIGLDAARLDDMPDSGLLMEAWRRWGEDCVDHLIGDFAFAAWDHRRRRLFLARDPMGQRGLFVHRGATLLVFATERKALWAAAGVPRQLDEVGLARRLLGTIDPDPACTLYQQVAVLPGGCLQWFDGSGAGGERRYWTPHAGAEHVGQDEAYYRAAYRRIVEEAVACRVRRLRTAPGLLFSGGFDSGIIAALAGALMQARGRRIVAVASVLPPGEQRHLPDARQAVAAFEGTPGIEIHYQASGEDSLFDDAEAHFLREDEPLAVGPMRRRAYRMLAGQRCRLVMDGHGGDYTVHALAPGMLGQMLALGQWRRFCAEFAARRRFTRWSIWRILRNDVIRPLMPERMLRGWAKLMRGMLPQWQASMANTEFAAAMIGAGHVDARRLRHDRVLAGRWQGRWRHMLHRVVNTAPHQTAAAVHGLVLSRPFHDQRIVELALAMPQDMFFREGRERWLARETFGEVLPSRLLARGPGNDQEDPDMFRSILAEAPAQLAELDSRGGVANFIDKGKIAGALVDADESSTRDQYRVSLAANAIMMSRFAAWLNRGNQEP